jgi:glucokinase
MRNSYAVGVDVGGTKIAVGLVERKGRLLKQSTRNTPTSGPFAVVDAVIAVIDEVLVGIHPSEVAGIGIGLPAQVDFFRQTVEFCTNLPLAGVDVRSLVMSRVKYEVVLDNDGHAAAVGESRFGAAKGVRDFLMVTIGTGVGGGLFVGGEPYRGHRGLGGELGHTMVVVGGLPCPCGGVGHLEAYVSRFAIERDARETAATFRGATMTRFAGVEAGELTAEHVIAAANAGDEVAAGILMESANVLGASLAGMVNLLNPELIVIGGGLGDRTAIFAEVVAVAIEREAMAGRRDVRVARAEVGNDAGVLGAAALAFDEYDAREGLH